MLTSRQQELEEKVDAGERLTRADGVALYASDDLAWLGRLAHHVRTARNGDRVMFNVNRHLNLTNVCARQLRVLLLPAQAGREGRVHDAGRGGGPPGQGDGGRAAHRAAHRQRPAPDAAVAVLPAGAARAEGGAAGRRAEGVHRDRGALVREDLRPARRRDPRRADRRRPGVADRRRRGDLRLGGPPAHRRPRHPLGGLVADPPARARQGPADPGDDALRAHRGAAAPGRPRAAAARAAGRDRRLRGLHPAALPARLRRPADGKVRNRLQARTTDGHRRPSR